MAEFQQVIDFNVNDHFLRNTACFCRHKQELRTRLQAACMTFTTDHVERRYGHHELVCGFACRSRDVRVERHLAFRSTCTTDCRRNVESCIGTGIRSRFHQESRPSSCRFLFPDVHTQQLVCGDIDDVEDSLQDTLFPKFALVSIARLRLRALHRSRRRPTKITVGYTCTTTRELQTHSLV